MAEAAGLGLHRCPVCFKTYKRREHLQRHRSTHTSERPHRCILCNASFQRTDVLKRHLQTCDGISNASVGRRRACDRCVRQKKACNSGQPCLNCEKRNVECLYSVNIPTNTTASSNVSDTSVTTPAQGPEMSNTPLMTPMAPISPMIPIVPTPLTGPLPASLPLPPNATLVSNNPVQDDSRSLSSSSAVFSTGSGNLDDNTSPTTTYDDVSYDDLDALIHDTISNYPVMDSQHPMHHGWLGLGFANNNNHHPQHLQLTQQPPNLPYQQLISHLPPALPPMQQQQQQQQQQQPQQQHTPFSDASELEREPFQREPSMGNTSASSEYRGYSFGFLYDFTSKTGLVQSFECGEPEQRQRIVAEFNRSYLEQQHPEFLGAAPPLFAPLNEPNPAGMSLANGPPSHGLSSWSLWLQNPIVIKLQQVVLLIKNVVMVKPNNSTVKLTWSPTLEQQCLHFFTPSRFAKFIELYWTVWHPNVNFLHRPTFDPTTSKSILLAAMALIGACVSPDPVDNEDAKVWFNCVEEMVFGDEDFSRDIESGSDTTSHTSVLGSRRKLQALQAAVVVCLYQNWEGSDASKRRIRRHRFSTVVSVARDLGIETARHPDYSRQAKHEFNWMEYVVREELIRTFLWIFLIDTAFVIFNNLPHRIVIKEMKMHMATPQICFQAATAEECIEEIHTWMPPGSPFCSLFLREAIETLCIGPMSPSLQCQYSQLGPVNLFAMVSAVHYMIFQHQNLIGMEAQLTPTRQALQNWIEIWERWFDSWSTLGRWPHELMTEAKGGETMPPDTFWRRIGFVKHSPEYWLLGTLLANRLAAGNSNSRPDWQLEQSASPVSMSGQQAPQGTAKSVDPILDKYDQTSMRQVNDLISEFKQLGME